MSIQPVVNSLLYCCTGVAVILRLTQDVIMFCVLYLQSFLEAWHIRFLNIPNASTFLHCQRYSVTLS